MGEHFAKTCAIIACACAGLMLPERTDALDPHDESWRPLVISGQTIEWPRGIQHAALELTYAFAASRTSDREAVNCRELLPLRLEDRSHREIARERIRKVVSEAFDRWSAVSTLKFTEAPDPAEADIVIGGQGPAQAGEPQGSAFTEVTLGQPIDALRRSIRHATICLDPARAWKIGFDGDLATYDLTHVVTHEIGHALGLDHPGARGAVMGFKYDESRAGLAAADILGIRAIYGKR